MLLKVVGLVILQMIIVLCDEGDEPQFLIKNKKTGLFLGATSDLAEIKLEHYNDSQLWTLSKVDDPSGYIIQNVGNGMVLDASARTKKIITYAKHGESNQIWSLQRCEATRLQNMYYTDGFLTHKDGGLVLRGCQPHDDSDKWFFIERDLS